MQDVKKLFNQTQVYDRDQNSTYILNIDYVSDCDDFEQQMSNNSQKKSEDLTDVSISYQQIIRDTYILCTNNNELRKYQNYECIRYEFYSTKIKEVFSDTTSKHYEYY